MLCLFRLSCNDFIINAIPALLKSRSAGTHVACMISFGQALKVYETYADLASTISKNLLIGQLFLQLNNGALLIQVHIELRGDCVPVLYCHLSHCTCSQASIFVMELSLGCLGELVFHASWIFAFLCFCLLRFMQCIWLIGGHGSNNGEGG